MKVVQTNRGFNLIEFKDYYGQPCSFQKSSIANQECIWLGVDKRTDLNTGKLLEDDNNFRMHLTKEQVQNLLPYLVEFAWSGEFTE